MKSGKPCGCGCGQACGPTCTIRAFDETDGSIVWETNDFIPYGVDSSATIWGYRVRETGVQNFDYKIIQNPVVYGYSAPNFSWYEDASPKFPNYKHASGYNLVPSYNGYATSDLCHLGSTGQIIVDYSGYVTSHIGTLTNYQALDDYAVSPYYFNKLNGCLIKAKLSIPNGNPYTYAHFSTTTGKVLNSLDNVYTVTDAYENNQETHIEFYPMSIIPQPYSTTSSGVPYYPTSYARWVVSGGGKRQNNTIGPIVSFPLYATASQIMVAMSGLPHVTSVAASGGPLCTAKTYVDIQWANASGSIDFLCAEYSYEPSHTFWSNSSGTPDIIGWKEQRGYRSASTDYISLYNDDSLLMWGDTYSDGNASNPKPNITILRKKFGSSGYHPFQQVKHFEPEWTCQIAPNSRATVERTRVDSFVGSFMGTVPIRTGVSCIRNGKIYGSTTARYEAISVSGANYLNCYEINANDGSYTYKYTASSNSTEVLVNSSSEVFVVGGGYEYAERFAGSSIYNSKLQKRHFFYGNRAKEFASFSAIDNNDTKYYNIAGGSIYNNDNNLLFSMGFAAYNYVPQQQESGYLIARYSSTEYVKNTSYDSLPCSWKTDSFFPWSRIESISFPEINPYGYDSDYEWRLLYCNTLYGTSSQVIYFSTSWFDNTATQASVLAELDTWFGKPDGVYDAILFGVGSLVDNTEKSIPVIYRSPFPQISIRQHTTFGWPPYGNQRNLVFEYRKKNYSSPLSLNCTNPSSDNYVWRRNIGKYPDNYLNTIYYSTTSNTDTGGRFLAHKDGEIIVHTVCQPIVDAEVYTSSGT